MYMKTPEKSSGFYFTSISQSMVSAAALCPHCEGGSSVFPSPSRKSQYNLHDELHTISGYIASYKQCMKTQWFL